MNVRTLLCLLFVLLLVTAIPACNDEEDTSSSTSRESERGMFSGALAKVKDAAKPVFVQAFSEQISKLRTKANDRMEQWDDEAQQRGGDMEDAYQAAKSDFKESLDQAQAKLDQVKQSENYQNAKASAIVAWDQAVEAYQSLAEIGRSFDQ